jgi:pimeloyl-ACP methyl ester carboxylesterase/DNA-binding CsgD family transcriptional regulator
MQKCDTGQVAVTSYATSGAVHIAYQAMGGGPALVYVPGWLSHLELELELPPARRFYEELARFCRLMRFDKRGTGMSDGEVPEVSLEDRVDDIAAVMDATGSERASLFGYSEGGAMAAVFAALHPERVDKLILFASHAGKVTGSADFPCGYESDGLVAFMRSVVEHRWGEGASLEWLSPSTFSSPRDAARARAWMARFERMAASPGAARAHFEFNMRNDARALLPRIAAPTLVLHRRGDRFVPVCNAEHLAANIPNAKLVLLDGEDHPPYAGDAGHIVDEVAMFLTGSPHTWSHRPWRARPAAGLDALTPAEHRVAEAVAEGLTNPQIASALHLSRHTVESHLKRIYAKLDVTRVELAALVLRDQQP